MKKRLLETILVAAIAVQVFECAGREVVEQSIKPPIKPPIEQSKSIIEYPQEELKKVGEKLEKKCSGNTNQDYINCINEADKVFRVAIKSGNADLLPFLYKESFSWINKKVELGVFIKEGIFDKNDELKHMALFHYLFASQESNNRLVVCLYDFALRNRKEISPTVCKDFMDETKQYAIQTAQRLLRNGIDYKTVLITKENAQFIGKSGY